MTQEPFECNRWAQRSSPAPSRTPGDGGTPCRLLGVAIGCVTVSVGLLRAPSFKAGFLRGLREQTVCVGAHSDGCPVPSRGGGRMVRPKHISVPLSGPHPKMGWGTRPIGAAPMLSRTLLSRRGQKTGGRPLSRRNRKRTHPAYA